MIEACYSIHDDEERLVHHRRRCENVGEAEAILANYPWERELALFDKTGEGGGLQFVKQAPDGSHATLDFVPVEPDTGFLSLTIVARRGLFGWLGRRAVSHDFDAVASADARRRLRELCAQSITALYRQYGGR